MSKTLLRFTIRAARAPQMSQVNNVLRGALKGGSFLRRFIIYFGSSRILAQRRMVEE
jgi:hypothetical protein